MIQSYYECEMIGENLYVLTGAKERSVCMIDFLFAWVYFASSMDFGGL